MLAWFPIIGTILLTAIIAWIAVSTWIGNRCFRARGDALHDRYKVTWRKGGLPAISLCCGASTTPLGWTQDGWVSVCSACGNWQYLGDDHANPPPGFRLDGRPEVTSDIHATVAEAVFPSPERCDLCGEYVSEHADDCPRRILEEMTAKQRTFADDILPHYLDTLTQAEIESGEFLPAAMQRPPNIGGEGNPEYAGPHYQAPEDYMPRYAPYDMLRHPPEGAAVFGAPDGMVVGPLPIEGEDDAEESEGRLD